LAPLPPYRNGCKSIDLLAAVFRIDHKTFSCLPNTYSEYDFAGAFVPCSNEKATRQQGGLFFKGE
jgi:hypothetical protein